MFVFTEPFKWGGIITSKILTSTYNIDTPFGPYKTLASTKFVDVVENMFKTCLLIWDTLNYTVKFRGIYTVGWKYRRKTPNTVG